MVIRSSSVGDVERLIVQLGADREVDREAAVARLRVLGGRAIDRVLALTTAATTWPTRDAALRVLEGNDDARVRAAAFASVHDADARIATAAIAVLRPWITRGDGLDVLDVVTGIALDTQRPDAVRLAALDVLSDLPRDEALPLIRQVSSEIAARTPHDEAAGARAWILDNPEAPLSELHACVVRAREGERQAGSGSPAGQDWLVTRAAAHAALARRASRVALYDLRESFDRSQTPLPLDFLAAITLIGDAACLESLARAWSATSGEDWWRSHLRDAAAAIVTREKLTARSRALKRVKEKYAGFLG